ncbi:MAG: 2-phosphosulfolactate phosphatase [Calditrichaeota bacterium]|nr:2-phosphosulfolactate phosphatase [Calditrichota bacterium]
MRIDLFVNRAELSSDKLNERQIAVVVDVLRATTTMVTAFANGCSEIIPVAEVEQALQQAKNYRANEVLLGGERNEQALPGFDLSNSPLEYTTDAVKNKTIVMTTTNGSQLFALAEIPTETIVCSFLNVSAVARYLQKKGNDVVFLCAGKYGEFGLEDVVCGGMTISKIVAETREKFQMNDGAIAAYRLYQSYDKKISHMLAETNHGKRLIEIGRGADLDFAAQVDAYQIVPGWKNGAIRLLNKPKEIQLNGDAQT